MAARAPSLMAGALMFAAIFISSARRSDAQEQPPNLRMLLNLDLFEKQRGTDASSDDPNNDSGDHSMMDQIQTLDSLGYFGGPRPAATSGDAGPNPPPLPSGGQR